MLQSNKNVDRLFNLNLKRTTYYNGAVSSTLDITEQILMVPLIDTPKPRDKSEDEGKSAESIHELDAQAAEEARLSEIMNLDDFLSSMTLAGVESASKQDVGTALPRDPDQPREAEDKFLRDYVTTTVTIETLPPVLIFNFILFTNVRISKCLCCNSTISYHLVVVSEFERYNARACKEDIEPQGNIEH